MVSDENITSWIRLIDGVLFDFGKSFQEYATSIEMQCQWPEGYDGPQRWDFYTQPGIRDGRGLSVEEFTELCNDGVDAGYIFRNNVHKGSRLALEKIKAMGHDIIVITDRHFGHPARKSQRATKEWWEWAGFPAYKELYFSSDKNIVPTDTFVEDRVENYDSLVAFGVDAYLINRPWNYIEGCTRKRINNIGEYASAIRKQTLLDQTLIFS